jgi:hypothetical protein
MTLNYVLLLPDGVDHPPWENINQTLRAMEKLTNDIMRRSPSLEIDELVLSVAISAYFLGVLNGGAAVLNRNETVQ